MTWNVAIASGVKSFVFDFGFFIILFTLALILFRGSKKSLFKPVVCVIWGLLTLYCFAPASSLLESPLQSRGQVLHRRAERSGCLETFPTIVVLGGGVLSRTQLSLPSYERVLLTSELVAQRAQGERTVVIFSGGPTTTDFAEADVMRDAFVRQNANAPVVLEVERESLNTYGNAVLVKEALVRMHLPPRVILVTHERHMPRAYATFVTQQIQVCAHAVRSAGGAEVVGPLIAFANGVNTFNTLNEYFGYLGYWMRGWISLGPIPQGSE